MANFIQILSASVLLLSIPLGIHFGKDFMGADFPLGFGLLLQIFIGIPILIYVRGYEKIHHTRISFGYFLFFIGLTGSYLISKSVWLLFFWELSTFGAILFYRGKDFDQGSVRSIVTLFIASGISMIFLSAWVFLPPGKTGLIFLTFGLLVKAGFIGFHFWVPEAYSGGPAHSSAAFSGMAVNLPFLFFVRYVLPDWDQVNLHTYLIPLAGIGVFFGGATSFFNNNAKRVLAYSSIEKYNFIWLVLLIASFWLKSPEVEERDLGKCFLILFYATLLHQSISKVFQFLSVGYLCKLADSNIIDKCKGFGRISGISPTLLGVGTFSFILIPGTLGFISEATFYFLNSKIIDLPFGKSLLILPAFVFITFGLALGGAAHLRLYLPTVLSVPVTGVSANKIIAPVQIRIALVLIAILIFLVPVLFTGVFLFNEKISQWTPLIYRDWSGLLFAVSLIMVLFYFSLAVFRWSHRIQQRNLWDCGNKYRGQEISIPSSVISDPLFSSVGRYFNNPIGYNKMDDNLSDFIHSILNVGKYWIHRVESGSISNYIAFSAYFVLISLATLILVRYM
ncbi:MAG: formate hydrogenase [Leptospira sp.]|nr:formate hydrogenase [Leptospira sp.]